jgi:hypothetical protein
MGDGVMGDNIIDLHLSEYPVLWLLMKNRKNGQDAHGRI